MGSSGEVQAVRSHHEVLERVGSTVPFAGILDRIPAHATQENPVLLEHVAGPAHAFACGLIASRLERASVGGAAMDSGQGSSISGESVQ